MHLPAATGVFRPPVLRRFIRENPLGILTTAIKAPSHPFIQSSHIPWVVDVNDDDSEVELGRLRGHIARQNPQAKAVIHSLTTEPSGAPSSPKACLEDDVLILFNGPVHHYITPKFYTDTKPATGKVVPTWDYEAVQVYGTARIYFDTSAEEFGSFLTQQLSALSQHAETSIMGYGNDKMPQPWQVSDAPTPYIDIMKKNIIGIEIEIKSMGGRFKMSQEKPKGDRAGVIKGFQNMESAVARQMACLVEQRAVEFDAAKEEKQRS
jgi:transcriptional regulator